MAVFWVVAPCSLVVVYRRFSGPCCLHHQGDRTAETSVNFYQTTRRYNPEHSYLRTRRRENLKSCYKERIQTLNILRVYGHCHDFSDLLCCDGNCQAVYLSPCGVVKFAIVIGYNDCPVNLEPKPLFHSGLHDFILCGIFQEYKHQV
jgi:hypothetical protein